MLLTHGMKTIQEAMCTFWAIKIMLLVWAVNLETLACTTLRRQYIGGHKLRSWCSSNRSGWRRILYHITSNYCIKYRRSRQIYSHSQILYSKVKVFHHWAPCFCHNIYLSSKSRHQNPKVTFQWCLQVCFLEFTIWLYLLSYRWPAHTSITLTCWS